MDTDALIKHLASDAEDRLLLKKALDKLDASQRKSQLAWTRFLSDRQRALCERLLAAVGVSSYVFSGGYEEAERRALIFLPDWMDSPPEGADGPLALVRAAFTREIALSHRDLLGALMGSGISRDTVGDILIGEGRADIVLLREVLPYVLQNLESAGRAKLVLTEIGPEELIVPQAVFELIKDTLASLRLDSLVSAGFSMSREKAAELIRSGRVSLNHDDCDKPDKAVAQGVLVSARGYGRIALHEVGGLTRKGRTAVVIKRFI